MTIFHRAAPGKGDGFDFVLSDETIGRDGLIIRTDGWDIANFERNPIALFGHTQTFPIGRWENLRKVGAQLVGTLQMARKGTSHRVDEIRSLIEQGILRAVSVGFAIIDRDRNIVTRQELHEVSVVSVPALPSALAMARSLGISDDTLSLAFGEQAETGEADGRGANGEHAATSTRSQGNMKMKTLSERIEDAQTEFNAARDALTELVRQDDFDTDEEEALSEQIARAEAKVASLKRAEASLGARAVPAGQTATVPATAARRPLGPSQSDHKPGYRIIRTAIVNGIAAHMHQDPLEVMERLYGQDEGVAVLVRAAVAPATTTVEPWAGQLMNTEMTAFLETLDQDSVYPALTAAGGGRLAFGPNAGAIKIPARAATPSIGGSFVGEGAPIPVRRLALTSVTLSPRHMGVITTFTREMAKYSAIALESMLRQEIIYDTAITLDGVLLGNGAGDAIAPAGLLNGVTPLTATAGGGATAILTDIRNLRAPFDGANAGAGLMLLMNPGQAEGLALTPGADGTLGWADGIMARYRVAISTAIPAGRVIMIRAADFATATGDVPEFELSNDATVHMEDSSPLAISSGPTGTETQNNVAQPVRSFFQTGVSGLRMIMDVSWVMRRVGMVQYIDSATW